MVSLTMAVGLAAAVGLTLAKFSSSLSEAVEARYLIHAGDLRATIETGISLGVAVEDIRDNVEEIVRDRIAVDGGILNISVSDASGETVFSLDRDDNAHLEEERAAKSVPIQNNFGGVVGEVTVSYETGNEREVLRSAARPLIRNAAFLAALASIFVFISSYIVMRPIPRTLRSVQNTLSTDGVTAQIQTQSAKTQALEQQAQAAATAAEAAMTELNQLKSSLPAAPDGKPA